MFILTLDAQKVNDMHAALQRALNTWEDRPEWLVELCDKLEEHTPSSLYAQIEEGLPLPKWAESRISSREDGYTMLRAQLSTRDGRKCGNAVITEVKASYGQGAVPIGMRITVMTDMGTEMTLNRKEIENLFHQPRFVMKQDAVGVRLKACVNEDEARELTAARATLMKMNFQWNGGELWAPPLGRAPNFMLGL